MNCTMSSLKLRKFPGLGLLSNLATGYDLHPHTSVPNCGLKSCPTDRPSKACLTVSSLLLNAGTLARGREKESWLGKVTGGPWLAVGSNFTAQGFGFQWWEVEGKGPD